MSDHFDKMSREELMVEVRRLAVPRPRVEILPCPCCGGLAELHNRLGPSAWVVTCQACFLNSLPREFPDVAVGMWNRRTLATCPDTARLDWLLLHDLVRLFDARDSIDEGMKMQVVQQRQHSEET